MTTLISVVLAEDHSMVREGIARLIQAVPGVELVGLATDGHDALRVVQETRPDVLLLDITMPRLGGLGVLARIVAEYPETHVIMLSMHDNEEYVGQALRAGADGYLLKDLISRSWASRSAPSYAVGRT